MGSAARLPRWSRAVTIFGHRTRAIRVVVDTGAMDEVIRTRLRKVVHRRWRIGGILTAVMVAGYFGFILLVAFAKSTAGHLMGDVSVGILIGAAVIVLAPVLTSIYVRWANRHYDPAVAALRGKGDKSS